MKKETAPNCYGCQYRGEIAGDCHSHCINKTAKVVGDDYGKRSGWFEWPWNFDPVWLISCDGFKKHD